GGREEREHALQRVGIAGLGGRQMIDLSGGQLQRALLAHALLHRPQLLVLDEAAQGLDQPGVAR
ncbi:MAG: ATP-binding cassette domain-containing protein, partial [Rhodobacteraceae bacterium]|nr:ATP-binding cassette domain-containing protein [Paracoccaceae bacterium]